MFRVYKSALAANKLSTPRLFHTSVFSQTERDFNDFRPEERYNWNKLRASLVKLRQREKIVPSVQSVTFIPKTQSDEVVVFKERQNIEVQQLKTLPVQEDLWQVPKLPTPLSPKVDKNGISSGYGRRKKSVSAVTLRPGNGNITVNGRNWVDYFSNIFTRGVLLEPIIAVERIHDFDITVTANGGGYMGQARATKMAIANALVNRDPELRFLMHTTLMNKRDTRVKERKHTGRRKARRRQQWVKR
eukprot:TRINITY_DN11633_c0_g1_i1.p1 TRINITY_DN11633_c0_g1~~TRINITY_DN11633_c0_g1_i1.p1  ORF type:complete len:245 (+),score=61.01 TRINITY_DN11633_c0_g1_i1:520-1254(+)